jgi:mycothiol synthase
VGDSADAGERPVLRRADELSAEDVRGVLALAAAAAQVDGAHPLSEHVVLHLRHGDHGALHLLVEDPGDGRLLGYAHLDSTDRAEGPRAELAVCPQARRRGVGTLLIEELVRIADQQPGHLRLWAHGANASAGHLAAARGFLRTRHLWQMRRSLYAPLGPVELPEGVRLRSFDPATDAGAWLDLNARAFADLPDQGGWTRADLDRRMAEPWFDPEGFLLAHDTAGRLLGFHWTKVHGHDEPASAEHMNPHDPIGEVYVVGVDPTERGRGLGRALTLAGLHHLRGRGLSAALLYVDSDNAAAIAAYTSLGFAVWDSDTLFRR